MPIPPSINETQLEYKDGLYYHNDTPFSGLGCCYNALGGCYRTTTYREGQQWGRAREWAAGRLVEERYYVENSLHGLQRSWARNGQLLHLFLKKRGEIAHRCDIRWNEQGQLLEQYGEPALCALLMEENAVRDWALLQPYLPTHLAEDQLVFDAEDGIYLKKEEPATGDFEEVSSEGLRHFSLRNGLLEGAFRASVTRTIHLHYAGGLLHGRQEITDAAFTLVADYFYHNLINFYLYNNNLQQMAELDATNACYRWYHPNGQLQKEMRVEYGLTRSIKEWTAEGVLSLHQLGYQGVW